MSLVMRVMKLRGKAPLEKEGGGSIMLAHI